jgi:hypothetical protein
MLQHGLDKHIVDKEANKWQSVVDHTGQTLQAAQLICSREYLSVDMDAYLEARMYVPIFVHCCRSCFLGSLALTTIVGTFLLISTV